MGLMVIRRGLARHHRGGGVEGDHVEGFLHSNILMRCLSRRHFTPVSGKSLYEVRLRFKGIARERGRDEEL
jgi:hypothetical protein